VYIPRFVTWGEVGQILILLDLLIVNWYGKKIDGLPARHTKALQSNGLATITLEGLVLSVKI
jgi:hypothetical protein